MAVLLKCATVALVLVIASGVVAADDLTGAKTFLCTAATVNQCSSDGECTSGSAWDLNIPQFIEVDLAKKTLSTTKASGENRTTPIKNIERENGLIILQGAEAGRAFSWVITEETGLATISVAIDGRGVVIFGACTPTRGRL